MKKILFLFFYMTLISFAFAQDDSRAFESDANVKQIISDFEKEMISKVARDTTGSFSVAIFKGDRIVSVTPERQEGFK